MASGSGSGSGTGSGDRQPLSLRPIPVATADKKPQNIADFIVQVNKQSGGFRSVTESQLHREIEAEANGQQNGDEDVDMSDSGGDAAETDATKEPEAVREEVLRNLEIAAHAAMVTLESISLLLSKQNPTTGSANISQQLRELVGIGTLGSDRLDASNVTPEMVQDKQNAAVGMTLMEVNQTRDSAQEATKFLQKEMEAEGKYWEEVMKVQSSGWSISRMPHERHTLGVRFGFSEAAPEFRAHGLAPIRRNDDGTASLDASHLGGGCERLFVTYVQNGRVVGRSSMPAAVPDEAPLAERVRDARDTIFAKELWHELTRESKTLAAYDVRSIGSSVLVYPIDGETSINLELKSLNADASVTDEEGPLPYDNMAELISVAIHILLSYAHRSNELMRVRPLPPQIPRSRGSQPHALLRPVIARLQSTQNIKACTTHVGRLTQALHKAGLPATFVLHTPQPEIGTPPAGPNQPGAAQLLIRSLLQPVDFSLKTTILADAVLTIRGRTFTLPATTTTYQVVIPESSPLQKLCPPYKEGYPDVGSLADYLRTAITRLLTDHALKLLSAPSWTRSVKGTSLNHSSQDSKGDVELGFYIEDGSQEAGASAPVVVLEKTRSGDLGKSDRKRWEWRAEGSSETRKLEEVLQDLGTETT